MRAPAARETVEPGSMAEAINKKCAWALRRRRDRKKKVVIISAAEAQNSVVRMNLLRQWASVFVVQ